MHSSSDQADLPPLRFTLDDLRPLLFLEYDPEVRVRQQHMFEFLVTKYPSLKPVLGEMILEQYLEDRLEVARAALRQVLARRNLTSSKHDDARVAACSDLKVLWSWLDRAYEVASVSEVLE